MTSDDVVTTRVVEAIAAIAVLIVTRKSARTEVAGDQLVTGTFVVAAAAGSHRQPSG